ncbi:putative 2-dehydropantoate 2-reductase [soil metagenome]
MSTAPHWYILGAGAIGGLLATHLVAAKQKVTLLLRDQTHCTALQKAGGIILSNEINTQTFPITAEALASNNSQAIDHLIVTTKAYDVLPALTLLQQRLHKKTQVILLQNGMGIAEQIKQQFPFLEVFNAITMIAAYRISRFRIQAIAKGPIWIGKNAGDLAPPWLSYLQNTDLAIHWEPDITPRLWAKLAINCAINPLSALLNCSNGQLLTSKQATHIMQQLSNEVELLMRTRGLPCRQTLLPLVLAAAQATADNYSSMQQDLQHDRLTEIDYINGYVITEGRKWGLTLAYNELMCELVMRTK